MTLVAVSIHDGVAEVRFNRPERLNALDIPMAEQWADALKDLASRDLDVVLLSGEGHAFCAGGDVRAMSEAADPGDYLRILTSHVHSGLMSIRTMPTPVVARLDGQVAGGGIGVALAADLAIASDRTRFTSAYLAVGLSPDCGASILLPEVIGLARARTFLLGGSTMSAAMAQEWGMVSEVVAPHELDAAVHRTASRLRGTDTAAIGATKALLLSPRYERHLQEEADAISGLAGTSARERLMAFAERNRA